MMKTTRFSSIKYWAVAGILTAGLALAVSCSNTKSSQDNGVLVDLVPPVGSQPGATYVGSEQCAACHADTCKGFDDATHARLVATVGDNGIHAGCEACHGPGSVHVANGGGKDTMINPKNDPDICFRCHLDMRAQFRLPHAHPVMSGQMSCTDCHNPHKGDAVPSDNMVNTGLGVQTAMRAGNSANATCARCHPTQAGPHAFEHPALREGCTFCHNPHGTMNDKMLKVRSVVLCLQCHSISNQSNTNSLGVGSNAISSGVAAHNHAGNLMQTNNCWAAGCHSAVHGSNTDPLFEGGDAY